MKIKLIVFLISILFLFASCNNKIEQLNISKNIEYEGIILALGDSLTEGLGVDKKDNYPSQLESFLFENGYKYKVINSGISGETSTGLSERIDWVISQKPDIIILTTGANDAMRGIDLDITRTNLEKIISKIRDEDIKLIFSGMQIYENLGEKYVNEFKNMYLEIAKKYDLPFISFFLDGVAGIQSLNNLDQIHPNKDGYKKIVEENIWPVLKNVISK